MRILHLIQRPQLRGAETFASQIGTLQQADGHEVLFLSLFDHRGGMHLNIEGPELENLSLAEGNRHLDVAGWKKLARRIQAFDPDVVQANAGDTLKYAVMSRMLFGWPGHLVFRNANNISSFVRGKFQKLYLYQLLKRVDSVVSVSENCRQDLIALFPDLRVPTTTITIGTPCEVAAVNARSEVRAVFGISASEPLLVNVGSFVPEKNHAALIRIFAGVRERIGSGHLLLIGDGQLREHLVRQAASLGLESYVHFAGYRQDVGELLFHADVMVMPSLVEGMPGVILEAMARGLPVIASDVGGIGEVVINNKTGWLVAAEDEEAFINATVDVLTHDEHSDKLAATARAMVRREKSIEKIAADFSGYYQKVTA